jgi:MinD-like ATPase involved in chromosome partitioning or flagellar assembly
VIVAVVGDLATTTAVSLAAGWPAVSDVVLVEADPSGGDLAAWLDIPIEPSVSTAVTRVPDGTWSEVERLTRLTPSGLRVLPAPARAPEAQQALGQAARRLVPGLAATARPVVVDVGGFAGAGAHPFLGAAAVTVAVHRQASQSARAAAVRLQRFADRLGELGAAAPGTTIVAAVVGADPFPIGEIEPFLASATGALPVVALPIDELAAAALGGRTGVSAKRLARLPLMRAARALADVAAAALPPANATAWRSAG